MWKIISYVFHPILMPTLGIFIVMVSDPYIYQVLDGLSPWLIFLSSIFVCTAVMPVSLSWLLLKMGRVTSLSQPTDNDRKQLMAFTELWFILAYFAVHNIPSVGRSLTYYMLGVNIAMIATLLTSLVTKVSLHAVGIGGILGTIIGMMYYTRVQMLPQVAIAIALVYLVGFSRYKLKAHNGGDIFIGNIIGISCQALVFFVGAK
jgi:hypothetical protein